MTFNNVFQIPIGGVGVLPLLILFTSSDFVLVIAYVELNKAKCVDLNERAFRDPLLFVSEPEFGLLRLDLPSASPVF